MHYELCIMNSPSATVSAALPADIKEKIARNIKKKKKSLQE